VDKAGAIYVTGDSWDRGTDPYFFCPSMIIIKYDSSGNEVWNKRYHPESYPVAYAKAMFLDAEGSIFVGGSSGWHSIAIKYDSEGNLMKEILYDNVGEAIAIDSTGNIFMSGSNSNDRKVDFATIKFDPDFNKVWEAKSPNTVPADDEARCIALDDSGSIYIAGISHENIMAAVKYDTDGNQLWSATNYGELAGMDLDLKANVYVAGTYKNGIILDKYDSSGNSLWTFNHQLPGPTLESATPEALLAVDDAGNAYVAVGLRSHTRYIGLDIYIIKADTLGNRLWETKVGEGDIHAIAVNNYGNVYMTGTIYDYTHGSSTIKYDSEGQPIWISNFSGEIYAMTLDASDNVYVAGTRTFSHNKDALTLIKYDRNGNQLWMSDYVGQDRGGSEAFAIVTDSAGNAYVAGIGQHSGRRYLLTLKFNNNGDLIWFDSCFIGNFHDYFQDMAIALDLNDNVYVASYAHGGGTEFDYITLSYDSAGTLLWKSGYNGLENGIDKATALAVDRSGNVFVTGLSENDSTGNDFLTIKYQQAGAQDGTGGMCFITTIF
jgi:hypothetical protein